MERMTARYLEPPEVSKDCLTNLTRLVDRLQQTVLRADAERERRLRTNPYERKKVESNIRFARSMLTKLEHYALFLKTPSRKQDLQADLIGKRQVLDQVSGRICDLEELITAGGGDFQDDDDEVSEGDDDILRTIIPTPSESLDSASSAAAPTEVQLETGKDEGAEAQEEAPEPEPQAQAHDREPERDAQPAQPQPQQTRLGGYNSEDYITTTSKTLRMRSKWQPVILEKCTNVTDTAHTTATERAKFLSTTATTEAVLDHRKSEQDALAESILQLASNLKASSHAMAVSLEEDREVMALATKELDKSGKGMEAASSRMGRLARMTEGKGWWGRMILYACVYGMMVVLIFFMAFVPKLRFSTW